MGWTEAVIITALLTFCIALGNRYAYVKGRRKGIELMLKEWKEYVRDDNNWRDM